MSREIAEPVRPDSRTAAAAAAMWDAGGRHYDHVSYAISDALAHAAQRLDARAGEHVLDIATGTGWSARNVARGGARVAAVDIAPALLDAARALSAHVVPPIAYHHGNAEALPFDDGAFDAVISTFGVMFAADHRAAAGEMARVCRPGGRLALAVWTPDGAVARFFAVIAAHSNAPAPAVSPLAWGDRDHLEALLADDFALTFEPGVNRAYHADCEAIWAWYLAGFGPLRALHDSLDAEGRRALRRDVDAYHRHFATPAGLKVERDYLVVLGRRR